MQLYPFQQKAADWLSHKSRGVLGSDVGLGKTATAVRAAVDLRNRVRESAKWPSGQDWILVVCPASVKLFWQNQISIWAEQGAVVIKKGTDPIPVATHWIIYSYDLFAKSGAPFVKPPLLIIFDEAHKIKSPRTKRTKTAIGAKGLAHLVPYVWFLTATPFPNELIDGYTVFNFCLNGALGRYWDFAEKYCFVKKSPWGQKIQGCRRENLPALTKAVAPILYVDTAEKVGLELPDFQETIIPLEPNKTAQDLIKQSNEHRAEIKNYIENHVAPKDQGKMVTLRRLLGLEKVEPAYDFIVDLLEEQKPLVVFAYHREVVTQLAAKFSMAGYRTASIMGGDAAEDRQCLIDRFQHNELDVLVLSIKAAGEGITLTAAATAVFVEIDWTPGALGQAEGRLRRIGQKRFCNYYFLQFPDSIDQVVWNSVHAKMRGINAFSDALEGKTLTNRDVQAMAIGDALSIFGAASEDEDEGPSEEIIWD